MTGSLKAIGAPAGVSLVVAALGSLTWGPLLVANTMVYPAIPWSVPVEGIALLLIWRYLDGWWWPQSTSAVTQKLLRARFVAPPVFAWAAIAGGLALVALDGLWIVFVEITGASG
jgi:hypothetical protein